MGIWGLRYSITRLCLIILRTAVEVPRLCLMSRLYGTFLEELRYHYCQILVRLACHRLSKVASVLPEAGVIDDTFSGAGRNVLQWHSSVIAGNTYPTTDT